jgi:hypothetical protein
MATHRDAVEETPERAGSQPSAPTHSDMGAQPEIAYYYPGPLWRSGDWVKTLLLFFDGVALLVPEYLRDKPFRSDPVMAEPLQDQGFLHILEPESFIDQPSTERLTQVMVDLITSGAFDRLDRRQRFHELSYSRLGGAVDSSLADLVLEAPQERGLARASEDGVYPDASAGSGDGIGPAGPDPSPTGSRAGAGAAAGD